MSPTPGRTSCNRTFNCSDLAVRLKPSRAHETLLPACSRSGSRRDRSSRVSKVVGRPVRFRKRETLKNSVIVLSRLLYSDKFLGLLCGTVNITTTFCDDDARTLVSIPTTIYHTQTLRFFLAWACRGGNRSSCENSRAEAEAWLTIYNLSLSWGSNSLMTYALDGMVAHLSSGDDIFPIETLNSLFSTSKANPQRLTAFHAMLNEMSGLISMEDSDLDSMLLVCVTVGVWDNYAWMNWAIDSVREELERDETVLTFEQVKFVFDNTECTVEFEPMREFCAMLAYYQRKWEEGDGTLKHAQQLTPIALQRRKNEIKGFAEAYNFVVKKCKGIFKDWWIPRDPRLGDGELDQCFFHIHEDGESCPSEEDDE